MAKQQERKGIQTHAVSLITLVDPSSPISEQYRTIRTNIQFASSADQQINISRHFFGTRRRQIDHICELSSSFCKIRTTSIVSGCRYAETHRPQNV